MPDIFDNAYWARVFRIAREGGEDYRQNGIARIKLDHREPCGFCLYGQPNDDAYVYRADDEDDAVAS